VAARGCFVTGTDTGAGKTILAAALCAAIRASGARVAAFKPVVTGVAEDRGAEAAPGIAEDRGAEAAPGAEEDRGAEAAPGEAAHGGWPADHELLAAVTGARPEDVTTRTFAPAVSPHLAAELAGETISLDALVAAAARAAAGADVLVVEGVGGLLVPFSDEHDIRDLAVALGLPVIIAARPGLGTINHSLLTIEAARAAGLDVRAVVLTPWPEAPTVMERSNRDTIASRGAIEVATLPSARAVEDLASAGATLPWDRWLRGGVSGG
jgi:dethiobiotin synthetase